MTKMTVLGTIAVGVLAAISAKPREVVVTTAHFSVDRVSTVGGRSYVLLNPLLAAKLGAWLEQGRAPLPREVLKCKVIDREVGELPNSHHRVLTTVLECGQSRFRCDQIFLGDEPR